MLILGGGPAGATAGMMLARAGLRVVILEKSAFPRFQIGESLLPGNFRLIHKLGLGEALARAPHLPKLGVELAMGDGSKSTRYWFHESLVPGCNEAINIARADFDEVLMQAAREAGAEVIQPATVERIECLSDEGVEVLASGRLYRARVLLDASGHAAIVGRHLGHRRIIEEPHLQKVAYFAHFEGVSLLEGEMAGFPTIVMCDEGWFWIIPLNQRLTSVGLVLDRHVARDLKVHPAQVLRWGIDRCPTVRARMTHASGPPGNIVRADFSYTCAPYSGPGHFLMGDAAIFLDPVFSTGVYLAMSVAAHTADLVTQVLQGHLSWEAARASHTRWIGRGAGQFSRLIRGFYTHGFREMFLNGAGPFDMHRGVLGLLAGHVFPRTPWRVRWRFEAFEVFRRVHRWAPLVPRRPRFSLLASPAVDSGIAVRPGPTVYGEITQGAT